MAIGDLPQLASSSYGSSTTTANLMALMNATPSLSSFGRAMTLPFHERIEEHRRLQDYRMRTSTDEKDDFTMATPAAPTRRLVKVVIVDPNENIPLDQCVLYSGNEKVTDATDQELFFEIDIKTILAEHNEKRTKVVDKKVKERTEYLEPAKIRDLKMVVVNIAQF